MSNCMKFFAIKLTEKYLPMARNKWNSFLFFTIDNHWNWFSLIIMDCSIIIILLLFFLVNELRMNSKPSDSNQFDTFRFYLYIFMRSLNLNWTTVVAFTNHNDSQYSTKINTEYLHLEFLWFFRHPFQWHNQPNSGVSTSVDQFHCPPSIQSETKRQKHLMINLSINWFILSIIQT